MNEEIGNRNLNQLSPLVNDTRNIHFIRVHIVCNTNQFVLNLENFQESVSFYVTYDVHGLVLWSYAFELIGWRKVDSKF